MQVIIKIKDGEITTMDADVVRIIPTKGLCGKVDNGMYDFTDAPLEYAESAKELEERSVL